MGFPLGGGDGAVTSARATFDLVGMGATLADSHVAVLVKIGQRLDGRIIARPMLLPVRVTGGASLRSGRGHHLHKHMQRINLNKSPPCGSPRLSEHGSGYSTIRS